MLLLPLFLIFPCLLGLLFATQNSALYRYPTGRASFGKFKCDPFYFSWAEKLSSSIVEDKLDCTFLCVGEPICYSFLHSSVSWLQRSLSVWVIGHRQVQRGWKGSCKCYLPSLQSVGKISSYIWCLTLCVFLQIRTEWFKEFFLCF